MDSLHSKGIEAVVITGPDDLLYFTGVKYQAMERLVGLAMDFSTGQAALVLPTFEMGRLPEPGLVEAGYADGEDAIAVLARQLKKASRIGLQKPSVSLGWAERLAECCGVPLATFVDITREAAQLRLLKDATELAHLRQACKVTDQVLGLWKHSVRPGVNERALRLRLDSLFAEKGVDETCPGTIIASGIHTAHAHGLGFGRDLCACEPIFIDCGARWQSYYCDITRTFFTGRPGPEMERVYQVVLEAQMAAVLAVRPGRPLREIDAAARDIIRQAGYEAYFTHRTGHGVGLSVHELPQVEADSEDLALPGMVFTVEPGVYLPGLGGVRIEDEVLVTEHGVESLTQYPKGFEDMVL